MLALLGGWIGGSVAGPAVFQGVVGRWDGVQFRSLMPLFFLFSIPGVIVVGVPTLILATCSGLRSWRIVSLTVTVGAAAPVILATVQAAIRWHDLQFLLFFSLTGAVYGGLSGLLLTRMPNA